MSTPFSFDSRYGGPVSERAPEGDYRIANPCRVEIIGPSGSGKSELMLKLVADASVWVSPAQYVVYVAPTLSDRHDFLRRLEEAAVKTNKRLWCAEGLILPHQLKSFSGGSSVLYLVDDLPVMSNCGGLNDLVHMHGRHLDIDCVFAMQTPFMKKRDLDMPAFTRDMTARFILYQRSDYRLYQTLNARIFPERKHWLLECLNYSRDKLGSCYVYIDCHPRRPLANGSSRALPREFMTMTNIFEDERVGGSPVFFDMSKKPK